MWEARMDNRCTSAPRCRGEIQQKTSVITEAERALEQAREAPLPAFDATAIALAFLEEQEALSDLESAMLEP